MSFNPWCTGPVASEEGEEGKQAVLLFDLAGPLSSHLNWIYSSIKIPKVAAKAAWRGAGGHQSAFSLINATCPTVRVCELTAVLLPQQISFKKYFFANMGKKTSQNLLFFTVFVLSTQKPSPHPWHTTSPAFSPYATANQ